MQTIALIDYGAGNLRSAERALLAAAAQANRRREVRVTADPAFIARADRIVLPGQGAFADCMGGLAAIPGLIETLTTAVRQRGTPFLGICVGMQLLADVGLEQTETQGLGWVGGVCRPLQPGAERLPHMGWNGVTPTKPHPVLSALGSEAYMYFAHSFVVELADDACTAARTTHGERFASALAKDNVLGVQFHPEKSQAAGLALLAKFVDWTP
jgi:glutamine amidotransferase